MSKHIELVKKWLADPASVKQQELEDNSTAADAAFYVADASYATNDDYAKYWIKRYVAARVADASYAAADASYATADARSAEAAYWVGRYEESKEQE